jgi:hypothetical protein
MAIHNQTRNRPTERMSNEHIVTDTNLPEGPVNENDAVIPVDARFENKFGSVQKAYNEGFASAQGVHNETAETDGAANAPELQDAALTPERAVNPIEQENAGLADN